MARIASIRIARPPGDPAGRGEEPSPAHRLVAALLEASPRVMVAAPDLCRADARGWGRRGGEAAFARAVHAAAAVRVGVGIADVRVAADAAAAVALREGGAGDVPLPPTSAGSTPPDAGSSRIVPPRTRIVPPGEARSFLAPLPLEVLGLPGPMEETLRTAGFRTVRDLAARERVELEARFGLEGIRAHRRALAEEEGLFRPPPPGEPPEASVELGDGVREVEPLLFVLGPLLDRLCGEVGGAGWHIRRLVLRLGLEEGGRREIAVRPARPTLRRDLLHELCRAGLERSAASGAGGEGRLPAPVTALSLRADERAVPEVRQEDLFASRSRDPAAASAAISRIRARLGEDAVVAPAPRPHHRPERRSRWRAIGGPGGGAAGAEGRGADGAAPPPDGASQDEPPPGILRLLPAPRPVEVRCEAGRPAAVHDGEGLHELAAAEGPERLSGDWWDDPYRREYYRVCTARGELLWIFREPRAGGAWRWWLHGWWD
ncbi:MAG TPA: hypothetical protein VKB18_06205 [Gemmatimonadota bacterium]|nr:hypothetical protein [Gemmatimonadota bacterium]